MTLIYKLFRADEWRDFKHKGITQGAEIDLKDGYIHFSTAEQLEETAQKHFKNVKPLYVLEIEGDILGSALKWEISRGGALFPHLYGALALKDVLAVKEVIYDAAGNAIFNLPLGQLK